MSRDRLTSSPTPAYHRNIHDVQGTFGHNEGIFGFDVLGMLLLFSVIVPINNETQTTLPRFQGTIYPAI